MAFAVSLCLGKGAGWIRVQSMHDAHKMLRFQTRPAETPSLNLGLKCNLAPALASCYHKLVNVLPSWSPESRSCGTLHMKPSFWATVELLSWNPQTPTVPQSHKDRVTTLGNPGDPRRAPSRPCRTLEETRAEAPENPLRGKFPRRASLTTHTSLIKGVEVHPLN